MNANLAIVYGSNSASCRSDGGSTFVDLYSPTFQLFASSRERFTINGIHLNANGYQKAG
jgi:hypothetical protein